MRFSLLLLVACGDTIIDEYEICSLEVTLDPISGLPGDEITMTGTPYTEIRDTRVEIGGVSAVVTSVERIGAHPLQGERCTGDEECGDCEGTCADGACDCALGSVSASACDDCDLCRAEAGCAPCGECAGIDLEPSRRYECFGDPFAKPPLLGACDQCRETATFVVPALPAGQTTVLVINRNGQSEAVPFEVLALPVGSGETGAGDTGASGDTGTGGSGGGGSGGTL